MWACHFSWAPGLLVKYRAEILIPSLGNVLWPICITITCIRKATDWSIPCQIMIALWMTLLSCLWTAASGVQGPHLSWDWNYPLQPPKSLCKSHPSISPYQISAKDLAKGSSQAGQERLSQQQSSRRKTKTGLACWNNVPGLGPGLAPASPSFHFNKSQLFTWETCSCCFVPGPGRRRWKSIHIILQCKCLLPCHMFLDHWNHAACSHHLVPI